MVSFIPGLVGGVRVNQSKCEAVLTLSTYVRREEVHHKIVDPDNWKTRLQFAVLSHVNHNEPLSVVIDNN
jgi:hypothetical protein